jgi:chitin disaccharide deacetylase
VRWPAATEAAEYAAAHSSLGVGLHLDLGEWTFDGCQWTAVYELESSSAEIRRQLEEFRRLVGVDPTHFDSHQHVHRSEPARSVVLEVGRELGVPVRHFSSIRYEGGFYGQDEKGGSRPEYVSVENLLAILRSLPEGATEICCHPGVGDGVESSYGPERERELETLCDPRVADTVMAQGIELRSFRTAAR